MYNLGCSVVLGSLSVSRQWLGGLSSPIGGKGAGNVACFHPGAPGELQQDGVTKMGNESNGTFTT